VQASTLFMPLYIIVSEMEKLSIATDDDSGNDCIPLASEI
jgi:hypothetical protein